jgi:N-acetylmuramoyl-L-alanine amidase
LPGSKRAIGAAICSILIISILAFGSDAAEMELMQGNARKGSVSVTERDGMRFVALDEVMTRLAFAASPISGGFVVTYSGKKIEFWNGSNAARINGTVNPLAAAVTYDGTHWWGEASSSFQAIKTFLNSVSRPSDIKLSPRGAAPPRNVPAAPPMQTPPRATDPSPPPSGASAAAAGAVISRVRWGEQDGAYRAVVDISEQAEASVSESPGRTEVTFKGAVPAAQLSGISPWPPLSVSSVRRGRDTVLVFSHSSRQVNAFWVPDPPRYVIDFYFDGTSPAPPAAASTTPRPDIAPPPTPKNPAGGGKIETVPNRQPVARGKFLVVIDAGHGGHDGGAVGNRLKEKDMNLLAALQLGISLKALGADVRLTRQDDRYLKLAERTEIANASDADVFISLHCNALPKGQNASGAELYLMAEQTDQDALNLAIIENRELSGGAENAAEVNEAADKRTRLLLKILGDMQQSDKISESTTLAEALYEKMRSSGIRIRKVRQAPFFVLRGAGMPAVLVEMGYITDAGDAKNLNSQTNRKKMMDALASGIMSYLGKKPGEGG